MKAAFLAGLAMALLPDLIRVVNDERARAHAADEAERQRQHDAAQKDLDRGNATDVARITAQGSLD